jgi:hypothetical protein
MGSLPHFVIAVDYMEIRTTAGLVQRGGMQTQTERRVINRFFARPIGESVDLLAEPLGYPVDFKRVSTRSICSAEACDKATARTVIHIVHPPATGDAPNAPEPATNVPAEFSSSPAEKPPLPPRFHCRTKRSGGAGN